MSVRKGKVRSKLLNYFYFFISLFYYFRENLFEVIDIFSVPSIEYCPERRKFAEYVFIFLFIKVVSHTSQGKYHLEDPSGMVELDLSAATFHTGLFTENCVVLIEGNAHSHTHTHTHTHPQL